MQKNYCRQCGKDDLPLNQQSGLCVRCAIDNEQMEQGMEEQQVRDAIRSLIERKEQRMKQLHVERKSVSKDEKPVKHRVLTEDIARLNHSIMTLIELEHNLRLCDCPDEAYVKSV